MIPATTTDIGLILYGAIFGVMMSCIIINAWRFCDDNDN